MRIAFNPPYSAFSSIVMDTIPNLALVLEIIFKFITAIYVNGEIVTDRKVIAQHYIQGRFL